MRIQRKCYMSMTGIRGGFTKLRHDGGMVVARCLPGARVVIFGQVVNPGH